MARQKLFDAFETSSRVKSAVSTRRASDLNLQDVREILAFRAVQTFINLTRANLGLSLIKQQESALASYMSRIETLVDEGAADEAELQQAREVSILLDNFKADYMGQIRAAESDYFELTGEMPPEELIKPASIAKSLPENLELALKEAEAHPSLRAASLRSEASKHDITAEKSSLFPDINAELSYMESDKRDIIGGEVEDARAVVKMNWNFETGGAQLARIKKSKYEYESAMYQLHDLERQIERGVRLAFAEYATARSQSDNQGKRLDLNRKLLSTYESQFEGARISLLQLMQADNQVFNTKLEKINAEHRLLLAEYGILASLGRLQNALGVTLASEDAPRRTPQEHNEHSE